MSDFDWRLACEELKAGKYRGSKPKAAFEKKDTEERVILIKKGEKTPLPILSKIADIEEIYVELKGMINIYGKSFRELFPDFEETYLSLIDFVRLGNFGYEDTYFVLEFVDFLVKLGVDMMLKKDFLDIIEIRVMNFYSLSFRHLLVASELSGISLDYLKEKSLEIIGLVKENKKTKAQSDLKIDKKLLEESLKADKILKCTR